MAEFYPEPSRKAAETTPNVHTLELSKAWYRRQAHMPEFIANEIEAYRLFSHIFQYVGTSTVNMSRDKNNILVRNRAAKTVDIRRPDRYSITLLEKSYMDPDTREWRGITPGIGFRTADGMPLFMHEQSALMMIDWLARGPFLPPSKDFLTLQNMAANFEEIVTPPDPYDPGMRFYLEKQRMYTETLESLADSLMIGRPEISATDMSVEFVMPRIPLTGWNTN